MASFNGKFKSNSIEWPTPRDIFEPLDREFHFTLDVCATAENTKCIRFFSPEKNGLNQNWSGVCWMNPPYGRAMIPFLKKAVMEKANGVITVALIPARTNTAWWHDLVWPNSEVRFVRGRPKFGDSKHGLPQPLAICIFKPKCKWPKAVAGRVLNLQILACREQILLLNLAIPSTFHTSGVGPGRCRRDRDDTVGLFHDGFFKEWNHGPPVKAVHTRRTRLQF